ncbi:hypothetical protein GGR54DRAFT_628336 [Hypoxylon sp. NC1633]|nr:hypothetical protein GGR54DRAFT_628336 [Hypoxylon sp. NC1633]
MGHKSKFTFPMPGRSSKPSPIATTSNPLSKAEKILGTGGFSLGSPTAMRDPGRSWETTSNGGISISISESSASQSGIVDGDDDRLTGTTYGRALWEEESDVLPRRLRSAHGPNAKALKPKRSAVTLGAHSRDTMTDDTHSRRPQSSSTTYSHYESAKVPLSISQQTSNSAMAKGLPSKASSLLDIGGFVPNKQPKKKPSKLDFSRLRLRSRKEQNPDSTGVGPVLGNSYVMRSPSIMSHMSHSMVSPSRPSPISSGGNPRSPRVDAKIQSQPPPVTSTRPGRFKGTNDAGTLHQLYDHYEQMSFRHAAELKEEDEEDEEQQPNQPRLLPRTYEPKASVVSREDTVTPLPIHVNRDVSSSWNHSRNTSQASKMTATRAGTPSTLQIRPSSRSDYPASVSSRHTRTSKATPSIMSTLDSDRQQHSVLSLTDSDSDEEAVDSRPGSSLPSFDNSYRDDLSVSSSQRHPAASSSRLSVSSHSTNPKGASYTHLNDYLTIPHASPKSKGNRSPSTNTLHSSNSSLSTATRVSVPSHQDPRGSVSTTGTAGSMLSPVSGNQTSYIVHEARAVAFTPLTSTAEAVSSVSMEHSPNNLNRIIPQQTRQRTSQNSHTSDQPTPPLSPTNVEFYKKVAESARQEPVASNTGESYNARLMAVTRQEEMLLAALRKKRARMRENIIAEIEEEGRTSRAGSTTVEDVEKLATAHLKDAERQAARETKEARDARAKASLPNNFPKRSSSLQRINNGHGRLRDRSNGPSGLNLPQSSSHSDPTEKISNRIRASPEPESRRTGKARHERVLLYLDRPIDSIDVIDQAEPSPDLSEFLDDELEFQMNERRSRTRSKLGSSLYGSPYHGQETAGRPRPDSSPVSPRSLPLKDASKIPPRTIEDMDADEVDFNDFEVMNHRRVPTLQSVPEKEVSRSGSPASGPNGLQAPPTFGHKKGQKSGVRLSAVGQISSPVPWWGDDD